MIDRTPAGPPPDDLKQAIAAFRRHAFAALLTGGAPRVAEIAETASRDAIDIAQAVAWLERHGELERDGELLVGAHGLTRGTTAHALTIEGRTLHTWCAYDAVAIPVALGVTAQATTTCPTCQRSIVVDIEAGHLPADPTPLLWLPSRTCEHVLQDFCAHANLFCDPDHLDSWRQAAGDPPGRVLALAEVPALASGDWSDSNPRGDP